VKYREKRINNITSLEIKGYGATIEKLSLKAEQAGRSPLREEQRT
jgi:hypothetical protein